MLAEIFQELLTSRDDYLRALRTLLREIMRSVRHDMNFTAFALGLMQDRTEAKFKNMESQHKVRAILAVFTQYKSSILCEVIRKHQVTSLFCKDCINLVISIFY